MNSALYSKGSPYDNKEIYGILEDIISWHFEDKMPFNNGQQLISVRCRRGEPNKAPND